MAKWQSQDVQRLVTSGGKNCHLLGAKHQSIEEYIQQEINRETCYCMYWSTLKYVLTCAGWFRSRPALIAHALACSGSTQQIANVARVWSRATQGCACYRNLPIGNGRKAATVNHCMHRFQGEEKHGKHVTTQPRQHGPWGRLEASVQPSAVTPGELYVPVWLMKCQVQEQDWSNSSLGFFSPCHSWYTAACLLPHWPRPRPREGLKNRGINIAKQLALLSCCRAKQSMGKSPAIQSKE